MRRNVGLSYETDASYGLAHDLPTYNHPRRVSKSCVFKTPAVRGENLMGFAAGLTCEANMDAR